MRKTTRPSLPSLAPVALSVCAALASLPVAADSGVGVDTSSANALNPTGVMRGQARDPDGMGEAQHSRSPSGFLIADPLLYRDASRWGPGLRLRGDVELGFWHVEGDREAAKFGEYKVLRRGPAVTSVNLEVESPEQTGYLTMSAGGLGRKDQFVNLTAGRYNGWRLSGFFSDTNHLHTSTYRNLWNGTGGARLTLRNLPAGPVAPATAASTDVAIGNEALATPLSSLSVIRHKGGLRLDMPLNDWLKVFAAVTSEQRTGARPFGLVSAGGGGTGGVEIPETVDYRTHDISTGMQWHRGHTSVNLLASASLFRNHTSTQVVDNPMFLAAANGINRFPQARYDLYPDNELYSVKAEWAHAVPELAKARFTAVVSAHRSQQNDALLPSTPYAGALVNGVVGGAWDTVASLSRSSAQARIDTRLADLGAAFSPMPALDLRAKLRHHETINHTTYWACNPLTGQWGRLINDGSAAVVVVPFAGTGNNPAGTTATAYNTSLCNLQALKSLGLVPSAGNVNIASVPYDHAQTTASLAADWRVARSQNLNLAIERDELARDHRERDRTWDDRVKLGYVNRALALGSFRAALELARRRGSPYIADPYEAFLSTSFGPLPTANGSNVASWIHINDLHRKFDLADRDQGLLNLRFNHALRPDMDLAFSAQSKDIRYPASAYGRNGHQRVHSFTADLNWQPAPQTQVYGTLAWQGSRMTQTGLQQNTCAIGSNYFFYSDGSVNNTGTLTPAQAAAGITVVAQSGLVTGANFLSLCGSASATSPLYPTSRAWTASQTDRSLSLSMGGRHDFGRARLEANYSHSQGRTGLTYTYNAAALGLVTSGAPTAAQLAALALIGSGMPQLSFSQDILDASLLVPLNKTVTVRLAVRHERGKVRDWHYDGVANNPTPSTNQQTYLDSGPQDYRVTAVGAFLQVSW